MTRKMVSLLCLVVLPVNLAALAFVPLRALPSDDDIVFGKQIVSSLGIKLVRIEPGKFHMGSPVGEPGRNDNEIVHEVEITKSFYMGVYEVTQGEYEKVMGNNPSFFGPNGQGKNAVGNAKDTRRFPVENASWEDAHVFCQKLTELDRKAGKILRSMHYVLPTEAEWEYCCRAGTTTAYAFGATLSAEQARCNGVNAEQCPMPVGSFAPNAWGLYDMHGNINEWCEDWYDTEYYKNSPRQDPTGPAKADIRVLRGGCWNYAPLTCRSALRDGINSGFRGNFCGFRVALRLNGKTN